ncbi:hypothetical protein [Lacticaseibacillus sp. GG6-2]
MRDELETEAKPGRNWYRWFRVTVAVVLGGFLLVDNFSVATYTGVVVGVAQERDWLAKAPEKVIKVKTATKTLTLKNDTEEFYGKRHKLAVPEPSNTRYRFKVAGRGWLMLPNVLAITRVN